MLNIRHEESLDEATLPEFTQSFPSLPCNHYKVESDANVSKSDGCLGNSQYREDVRKVSPLFIEDFPNSLSRK
jgi:hypothetical protein